MIYPIGGLVVGAILGALAARRRGGKIADLAQWGAVWALILGFLGLMILIALDRASR